MTGQVGRAPAVRIEPKAGQESVWDYPRPPLLQLSPRDVRVEFAGVQIAKSTSAFRILERSHPPGWYIPRQDVAMEYLQAVSATSFCEFKGMANYFDIVVDGKRSERAAWSYDRPWSNYTQITGCLAFYPGRVDACFVDHERVEPQEGDFYGGWITSDVVGPFKGPPGTHGW